MRLDHFAAAAQQLDCGFDRHHYPPDSFGSASSSKTEQVKDARATKSIFQMEIFRFPRPSPPVNKVHSFRVSLFAAFRLCTRCRSSMGV